MDEQLYEHYRTLIDLFRQEAPRALKEAEEGDRAAVAGAVLKAVGLNIMDGEIEGAQAIQILKDAWTRPDRAQAWQPEELGLYLGALSEWGGDR